MTKLHELLQQKPTNGLFGIEIETEGRNLSLIVPPQWKIEDDGSLRGQFPTERAEYVLKKPLDLQKAIDAVTKLREMQDDNKAVLNFSFRTSVHVHVNVQQLTFPQYLNMIYTYLLLEEPLVRYCGKERVGNRFCLRLQDAEGLLDYLFMLFRQGYSAMRHINGDAVRYAAINVAATAKYGSLEFRSLKGNMDVPYITTWIQALDHIRSFAMEMKDPQEVHNLFVNNTPEQFAEIVLGDVYDSFVYPNMENDMRTSFSLALELPYNFIDSTDNDAKVVADAKAKQERYMAEMAEAIAADERKRAERVAVRRDPAPVPRIPDADDVWERPINAAPPIDWADIQAAQERIERAGVRRAGEEMAMRAIGRRPKPVHAIIVDDLMNEPIQPVAIPQAWRDA
jgi:hypothetical protein